MSDLSAYEEQLSDVCDHIIDLAERLGRRPTDAEIRKAVLDANPTISRGVLQEAPSQAVRELAACLWFNEQLRLISRETGILMKPDTPVGDLVNAAAAAGNERALRLLGRSA